MIYTAKMHLIIAKIDKLNFDIMCHVQFKTIKKLIKAKPLINLGKMWLSLAQLSQACFFYLDRQQKGPQKILGPGPPHGLIHPWASIGWE